jgi:protein-tyrosine-phosphatase
MVKKLIEMVCTGNNGRSPVAELVGRNYLEEIGASDDYDTISSGTMVDKIGKGGFSNKALTKLDLVRMLLQFFQQTEKIIQEY